MVKRSLEKNIHDAGKRETVGLALSGITPCTAGSLTLSRVEEVGCPPEQR